MRQRVFIICALAILALELLALGRLPPSGPSTAEIEGIVARQLQAGNQSVSDVRCTRRTDDAATCVAILYDGSRTRLAAAIDLDTGRVVSRADP